MNTYKNFLRLYAENRPYEDEAVKRAVKYFSELHQKPFYVSKVQDQTNHRTLLYDAQLRSGDGGEAVNIEVKTDHKSRSTGNFFIEHHQYGKVSGILTTQADYYIINDTTQYFLIRVSDILEILEYLASAGRLVQRKFPNSDGLWTEGYLIQKQLALKFATELP
jgi:hypothetical protein